MKITVIGSLNYDIIFKNSQINGSPGGGCLNVSFNLTYLKADYVFITQLGNDQLAQIIKSQLTKAKINLLPQQTEKTNLAVGFSDSKTTVYSFYKSEFILPPLPRLPEIVFLSGIAILNAQNLHLLRSLATETLLIFDCNFRSPLNDFQTDIMLQILKFVKIIKKSDEDKVGNLDFSGKAVFTTFSDGVEIQFQSRKKRIFIDEIQQPASVVGAGDAFCSFLLFRLQQDCRLTFENLCEIGSAASEFARQKVMLPASYFLVQ
ncbi:Fructokinase [Spironucleus salmonicida]|uniref:Fructokinase n=1 Tax=Spironucleus salmonicida TaxID=348837 RepID=V6LPR3_9EUKA|nr:Fructokinase [Spironucleus salmonicida]|eukprot:EST46657.1 pfkB family carbohydrate kinase, putative [Spironucleus salmonicida]